MRAAAIVAAACILLAHLISLHHETAIAHVRDTAGQLEHAHALAEHHEVSSTPHLHGREDHDHADVGPCALLVGLEQSTIIARAPALVLANAAIEVATDIAPPAIASGTSVLSFAPKTSPPSLG